MSLNIKSRASSPISHIRHHWIGVLGAICVGSGLMGYTSSENSVAQASTLKVAEPMLLATPRPRLADLIPPAPIRDTVSVSLATPLDYTSKLPARTSAKIPALAQSQESPVKTASTPTAPTTKSSALIKRSKDTSQVSSKANKALATAGKTTLSSKVTTTPRSQPVKNKATLLTRNISKSSEKVTAKQTTPAKQPHSTKKLAETQSATQSATKAILKPVRPAKKKLADYQIPVIVRSGDSLARIMNKRSFDPEVVQEILALGKATSVLKRLHPGDELFIGRNKNKQLSRLDYSIGPFKSLQIRRINNKLSVKLVEHTKTTRIREASGTIQASFYEATNKAGMTPGLSITLANIFEWDIDFAQDLRKGDKFSIIYEEYLKNGKPVGTGNILAAEFSNRGNHHRAIRFQAGDSVGYYDANGRPLRKAFLRTPVKYSHISSKFTRKRWHPILKRWRAHRGVDYAAARGTPIRATGRGKIKTIGKMRGYGNVVMIQHANKRLTVYGHMNGFARKLKRGSRVQQGQVIGYVGSTGYATGPHLHYEFRINNKHRDPLRVVLPKASPLPKRWMNRFREQSEPLLAQLNGMQQPTVVAQRD